MIFLTESEAKIKEELNIEETYPYTENGIEKIGYSFNEVLYKAVLSYETFTLTETQTSYYTTKEIDLINKVIDYQTNIGAYYSDFFASNNKVIENPDHLTVKNLLNKAAQKHKGIYFVFGLQGFCSTTLHNNPIWVRGKTPRKHKERFYGPLVEVVVKTLEIEEDSFSFYYPYKVCGEEKRATSIYEVYQAAFSEINFELLGSRQFYSKQERKIARNLHKKGVFSGV